MTEQEDAVKQIYQARQGGRTKEAVEWLKHRGGVLLCPTEERARAVRDVFGGDIVSYETRVPKHIWEEDLLGLPIYRVEIVKDTSWGVEFKREKNAQAK